MNQIFSFSTLCTVSRNQNVGFRHYFTKDFSHLRISSSHNCSDVAIIITHAVCSPLGNLFSDQFVKRTAIDQPILEFSTGWIGCLNKDKKTFLLFFTYFDKWLYSVRSKIRIHSSEIFIERYIGFASYLNFSKMSNSICC